MTHIAMVRAYEAVTYKAMAYVVVAYIVMAYIVMAYIVTSCRKGRLLPSHPALSRLGTQSDMHTQHCGSVPSSASSDTY